VGWVAKRCGKFSAMTFSNSVFCLFLFAVGHECEFKDTDNIYRFAFDEEESDGPGDGAYSEEDLDDVLIILSRSGPDAQLRMALRKS